jgi:uncharacterized protein (TIGR03435 family)
MNRACILAPIIPANRVVGGWRERTRPAKTRALAASRRFRLALPPLLVVGISLTAVWEPASRGQGQPTQKIEKGGIAGAWQGTVHTPDGPELRMVLKIMKDDKGGLTATLYSIDQSEPPITSDSVRFEEETLRFVNDFPSLTYVGKMSAGGNSMSGTVTRAGGSLPLMLERATPETEWATPAPPLRISPMAPDAKPDVDVSTVKPTRPGTGLFMLTMQGGNLVVKNLTLGSLVKFAYDVPERQIADKPDWMDTDKWDIEAKPDTPGMPNIAQERMLLQKLLTERFGLRFHEEKRALAAYVLIVGKDGPKMAKTADASEPGNFTPNPRGVLGVRSQTMGDFAHVLQNDILGQPVVDNTGLQGKWDFTLKWTPDETQFPNAPVKMPPPAEDDVNASPPLFTAIQEQLGLKLEAEKADVSVMVIDHVDRPSPN